MGYPPYLHIQSKIGEKLKKLRKSQGFTSYENFAIENDLDRKQYWEIEKGKNITIKTLYRLLEIHNIAFSDFFKDIN